MPAYLNSKNRRAYFSRKVVPSVIYDHLKCGLLKKRKMRQGQEISSIYEREEVDREIWITADRKIAAPIIQNRGRKQIRVGYESKESQITTSPLWHGPWSFDRSSFSIGRKYSHFLPPNLRVDHPWKVKVLLIPSSLCPSLSSLRSEWNNEMKINHSRLNCMG